jgi:hypothetical protein
VYGTWTIQYLASVSINYIYIAWRQTYVSPALKFAGRRKGRNLGLMKMLSKRCGIRPPGGRNSWLANSQGNGLWLVGWSLTWKDLKRSEYISTVFSTHILCCLVPRRFGLFTCARGTAREGEKRKIVGKRLVEFAFKMAGQCSASVLYYLYYYWNDIVYSKIRVRTLPVLFGVQYLTSTFNSLPCSYCFNILTICSHYS